MTRDRMAHRLDQIAFALLVTLAASLAFEWIEPLLSAGGVLAFTNVELLLLTALAAWLLSRVAGGRWPAVPATMARPAGLWLLVLLASALLAPAHRVDALKFTARTASGLLAGWAAYDLVVRSPHATPRRTWLLQAMALGGALVAALGLAEYAQLRPAVDWLAGFKHGQTVVGEVLRVSASLGYATVAAMILELTAPLLLVWAVTARRRWLKLLLALGLLATLAALVLTLSRGGVIALTASLLLMALLAWRLGFRALAGSGLAATAGLLALVGLLFVVNPVTLLRLTSESAAEWYRATYIAPESLEAVQGEALTVPIQVTNAGVRTWEPAGDRPFMLSYHVLRPDGTLVAFDGVRTPLPQAVAPGESVPLDGRLRVPVQPGDYVVAWEMLQEGVAWFADRGAEPATMRLEVLAGTAGGTVPAPDTAGGARLAWRPPPVGRLQLWSMALSMVRARPLLGVGPDNYRLAYGVYADTGTWDTRVHANNLYLEWLADTGILGFLVFIWLNAAILLVACRNLALGNPQGIHPAYAKWQVALLGSLAAWYVHGLFDSFYEFTPTLLAFWLLAGLAVTGQDSEHYRRLQKPHAARL